MINISDEDLQIIRDIRHDLHQHPEKSGEEIRTTRHIRDFLEKINDIEIIDFPIKTGLIARLNTGKNGKVIAIRSDIDALEQKEETDIDYKSLDNRLMHACGHDFHTSVNLGLVKVLSDNRKKLKGDVVFIFQRSEEITKGAKELVDLGLFEKVKIDYIFGLHNWPLENHDKVILKRGALMSTKTNFKIKILGHGQHGSIPQLNIDPIVCASNIVMSLQTIISRNTDPFDKTVLSVNSINGGSEDNLVVDTVSLSATIRSLSEESLNHCIKRMEEIVEFTAKSYQCRAEIEYTDLIPLVYNQDKMYEFAEKSALKVLGEKGIIRDGETLASEDFAFYMKEVPGFFYWFGSAEEGHEKEALHSRKFYCSDKALKTAINVMANAVIDGQEEFNKGDLC